MELPRFTIRDSDHKAVHEAYLRPLEKREAELSSALREALASFKCTQRPADYAHNHWSNRATTLLANNGDQRLTPKCNASITVKADNIQAQIPRTQDHE